jgi:hypothetical protein
MLKTVAIALVMSGCTLAMLSAQEPQQNTKTMVFHVTSVQQVDGTSACKSGMCSAVKYTIEGYAEIEHNVSVTEYVITCDEFAVSHPHPHRNNICARVHAGSAYVVELLSNSVAFPYSRLNKEFEANYSIVSEKEASRGTDQLLSQNNQ